MNTHRIIIAAVALFVVTMALCVPDADAQNKQTAFGQWSTNATSAASPIRLYPANAWVSKVTVLGKKAARTDNVGLVYIGVTSANDTQVYPVQAGGEVVIVPAEGTTFNLSSWYLDVVNANDGVIIIFQ